MTRAQKSKAAAYSRNRDRKALLTELVSRLPDDDAKMLFIEYALSVVRMGRLREYLRLGPTHSATGASAALTVVSELMAASQTQSLSPEDLIHQVFDALVHEEEREGFMAFCDAVIGYQETQVALGHRTWRDWV